MAPIEASSGSVTRRRPAMFSSCHADGGVVWLRGGHDTSTVVALCTIMARAIGFDHANLVIDLSEVTFMDAATVGVITRAEGFLRDRSRSLTLRSPSPPARHVLALSGLADLVDPAEFRQVTGTVDGLAGQVGVPATTRADEPVERAG
jgi:anti-anti-sigma factor